MSAIYLARLTSYKLYYYQLASSIIHSVTMSTLYLLLLGMSLATSWHASHCQDISKLMMKLQERENYQTILKAHPHIKEEIHGNLDVINKLWTDYFPRLLNNSLTVEDQNVTISQECADSGASIIESLSRNVAIPEIFVLLDATGKLGAGLLEGNTYLDGAFDECFQYNYTGYCVARGITLNSIPPSIPLSWTAGLCVPKYCTAHDVAIIIRATNVTNVDQKDITCANSKHRSYSSGAVVMITVCVIFALLVIVETVLDCIATNIPQFFQNEYLFPLLTNSSPLASNRREPLSESVPLLKNSASLLKESKWKSHLWELATAFSLFKTIPTLLETKQAPTVITSLNGIRVISMFWVILAHNHFWLLIIGVDNVVKIKDVASRFSYQAIDNGFFSVDSFFFLSGVLVAYLTLRQMKKKDGRFPIIQYYVHRYLRLTPTYAFVLFFTWSLTAHLGTGPILSLSENALAEGCSNFYWLTNLFYINNFLPWDGNTCIGWAWYLANDMQFYIIAPLMIVPAYFLLPIGLIVTAAILLVGFIVTASLAGVYDFQANTYAELAYGYVPSHQSRIINYNNLIYIKPWGRISPYIVGLVLGYVLYRGFRLQFGRMINTLLYLLLWVASGIILGFCLYGLIFTWHGHVPSKFENVVYITFSRFGWGIGLALIVFACHNGYGWFINSFLSMKMWTPLSRMSYNAYLIHPVVLTVVYGQFQKTVHYSDITLAVLALGCITLSYGAATVICLLVEYPLGTIEMLAFKILGSKHRESQRQIIGEDEKKMPDHESQEVKA